MALVGSTSEDIASQLVQLPACATHLVLSCGGNDALNKESQLYLPAQTNADGLAFIAHVVAEFEESYKRALDACMRPGLPLVVCTIYNGNFPAGEAMQLAALRVAVACFNDVIIRAAIGRCLRVIDLRLVCNTAADYANPIEPSSAGGAKIAQAIVRAVTEKPYPGPGAQIAA